MQRLLGEKKNTNERLHQKNNVVKRQLAKLQEAVRKYQDKIKQFDSEIKSGKRVMELPCNHAETINQLEVHLKSKQNEIDHLKEHLSHLQHSNDHEILTWKNNLARLRYEREELSKQSIYSDANVIAIQRVNELKGQLIKKNQYLDELRSEVIGLRNVKKDQHQELSKQTVVKNFPTKIQELVAEIKALQEKEKYI